MTVATSVTPESVVAEAEPALLAEEPVEVSPEPVEPDEGEGEPDERVLAIRELFKGMTAAELRAALDEVPPEARADVVDELERRGEQRARTREKEVEDASKKRMDAYEKFEAQGKTAESWLSTNLKAAKRGEDNALYDVDTVAAAIEDYRKGAAATFAIENERNAIGPVLSKYLPDQTDAERDKLEKPLYNFGKSGDLSKVLPTLAELIFERAKAQGLAEGQSAASASKEAKESLADKLANIETIRKQAPGVRAKGGTSASGLRDQYRAEMQKFKQDLNNGRLPPEELKERSDKLDQLAASLPKE